MQVAIVGWIVLLCINPTGMNWDICFYILFTYSVFSFSLSERVVFSGVFRKYEISYGIYLWGFFVQQVVILFVLKSGF